jgi:hypothetical protein
MASSTKETVLNTLSVLRGCESTGANREVQYVPGQPKRHFFHPATEEFEEQMLVLTDNGCHARQGDPQNISVVSARPVERAHDHRSHLLALRGTLGLKKLDRRLNHTLAASPADAAAHNICIN